MPTFGANAKPFAAPPTYVLFCNAAELANNNAAGPLTWVCPEKVFAPLRVTMPELLLTRPPVPPITADICTLPEPASASVLPLLATLLLLEMVSRLGELLVQVWLPPKISGADNHCAGRHRR